MAANRIWLIRHGQSTSNVQQPTEDPGSAPLTPLGREQAKRVAAIFPGPPDLVAVSPFPRAAMTAKPLLDAYPGTAREVWPVQEFTYLSPERYRGTTMAGRRPMVAAYWERLDPGSAEPGAESFVSFAARVRDFFDRLRGRRGFTAVFTHGQFMRGAIWWALMRPAATGVREMAQFRAFREAIRLPNASVAGLHCRENGSFCVESIAWDHLPPDQLTD
ncbi:MAG: histidine phosphatase family protein [Desulfovibrionaceae bacterium]|nr:histidine phosphatase family protein [Desulfovibrionaceae bacterium]MBF0515077.1 histidine phosphatase family protein [Desulfovibrionaceae bacterium]